MNLVLDDTIRIPPAATGDLEGFRRWTKSKAYPDRGDYAWLNGELWVDLSMETLLHNEIRSLFVIVLGGMVRNERLGRFWSDRMRLVHDDADLSTEPDAMFVSHDALRSKQVRLENGAQSLEVIGTPDMVLVVVSRSSVQKDTVVLRELYASAGIPEYWLVNPLGDELSLDILRLTSRGYVAGRKAAGWVKSAVFGKSFRLECQSGSDELPDIRLLVR